MLVRAHHGSQSALAAIGSVLGLLGALAAGRVLESLILSIATHDLLTFVGVTVLLGAVVLVAALIPAARATRVAPVTALKSE